MLQRVRELAVQAQSGTNSAGDIANLQLEAEALMTEITRVSSDTTYNNKAYLGADNGTISIQVGYNDGDTIDITTYNIDAESLGVAVAAADNGDDSDVATADLFDDNTNFINIEKSGALAVISNAIDQVAGYKAEWGAGQNRLEYTVSNLMNVVEFTTAARSRIQDADFAVEAARLAKAQVLQQTGTAMLAQANAAPQIALQLLK